MVADPDKDIRGNLINAVQAGEMTPRQADGAAAGLGVGPLDEPRNPERFDPLRERYWTLPMAVAWITWRDFDVVRKQMISYRAEWKEWVYVGKSYLLQAVEPLASVSLLIREQDFEQDRKVSDTCISAYHARDQLWQCLREKRISADGVCQREGRRKEIPAQEWQDLRIGNDDKTINSVRSVGRDRGILSGYDDVLVRGADVLELWPAGPSNLAPAIQEARVVAVPEVKPARPLDRAETETAYLRWLAEHEVGVPPSRDADEAHMKSLFPSLTRKRVRDLRRRLAPPHWSATGPRKRQE